MAFNFKTFAAVGALIGSLALVGCGQDEKDPNHIKVGVIVGAEQQVAEVAQKVAKEKYGLDVELVTFNDYVLPNEALSKGDIDVNAFQHKPYLDQQIKDRGYKLVAVGNTFVYPIAGYSKKSNRWTNCSRAPRSPSLTIRLTSVVPCCCCSR
ncbi:methionine ABC transporter substrate-binding protein [Klebsiella pneumoniae subsp. pneumoniae]|nr:methionine ABC transporter substrate-binding protein [Klebsiella pneumoniae subsp. pneumoniae]